MKGRVYREGREREREKSLPWFILHMATVAGPGQNQVRLQEIHPGFPFGCRDPNTSVIFG